MYGGYRTERRKYKRLRVSLAVLYSVKSPSHISQLLGGREFDAETLDISEGGVALTAWHYLPLSTRLFMRFVVSESDSTGSTHFYDSLKLFGEVRYVKPAENNSYRLGIAFENMSPEQEFILSDFICSPLKPLATV